MKWKSYKQNDENDLYRNHKQKLLEKQKSMAKKRGDLKRGKTRVNTVWLFSCYLGVARMELSEV